MDARINVKQSNTTKPSALFFNAWHVLVAELGPLQASKFISLVKGGFGDSVEERRKLWKGKKVRDIIREIERFS